MLDLSFRIKRAYWSSIRVFGAALGRVKLTPARFDMLYVIHREVHLARSAVPQSALPRILGVSRMTVSKMVRRMFEIGLLHRRRHVRRDRRTWYLALTLRAARALRAAYHGLHTEGVAEDAYSSCFEEAGIYAVPADEAREIMLRLLRHLNTIAWGFGDGSSLRYTPAEPDELYDFRTTGWGSDRRYPMSLALMPLAT